MKQTSIAAAFLAVGATAQNSTSTIYSYYNTCSLTAAGVVTATSTDTWCPPCEAASMTIFAGGSLTTYVTTFKQVCPTDAARLEDATYTVTEPCPSTGLARDSSYMPQGFTVSTVSCSACESGKSQYAQTTPGPALASALATPAPAPAVPTPAAAAGNAAPPAPAGGSPAAPGSPASPGAPGAPGAPAAPAAPAGSPAGSPAAPVGAASPANAENAAAAPGAASPAGNGAAAPAGSPAGAPAPYPLPSQAGQVAAASGAPASNGTVPFTGTGNTIVVGISSFITALATLITGFAFVL